MKDLKNSIFSILTNLKDIEGLKQLFWSELNYNRINNPLSRDGWPKRAGEALAENPLLLAGHKDFAIIYGRLNGNLNLTPERAVVNHLLKEHPYALFVFSDNNLKEWHFVNVKLAIDEDVEKNRDTQRRRLFRRIKIGPYERLRTAVDRLTLLDFDSIHPDIFGVSPLAIQHAHDEAFDVEQVTRQFFSEYQAVINIFQEDLTRQTNDRPWAHDYALQFLNRCMFLYFIQRKKWLGDNPDFLHDFWKKYRQSGQKADLFFEKWLKLLFFEAFNNKFHGGHDHFPKEIREALALAPYLNGGLFQTNEIDQKYGFTISDTRFEQIFTFLERYNFTIAEDSPLDQEVAVDPEMIGKVYESLVNVSTEADTRGDAGIFYTPRTEIDLMCRLTLVDNLANHLGQGNKSLLYEPLSKLIEFSCQYRTTAINRK